MRSFYMSIYDVSYSKSVIFDPIYSLKNQTLPNFKWTKTFNNTHGYIRATVDFSVGPKPMSAFGYRARTLNNKRFVELIADFCKFILC